MRAPKDEHENKGLVACYASRIAELEERLRRTIDGLEDLKTMPPVMYRLGLAAIVMDARETLERKWIHHEDCGDGALDPLRCESKWSGKGGKEQKKGQT